MAKNPYFTDAAGDGVGDIELEQIMCEYEALFEPKEDLSLYEDEEVDDGAAEAKGGKEWGRNILVHIVCEYIWKSM